MLVRPPPGGAGGAWLLVVHGRGEHGGRYARLAGDLAARAPELGCAALDLRGFGRAPGPRGHVDRFADYLEDVDAAWLSVRSGAGGAPVFLLGHSAGGLIAVRWVQTRPPSAREGLAGLVLSSPFLALPAPLSPWTRAGLAVASVLAPTRRMASRAGARTRDAAEARAFAEDPLSVHHSTVRWAAEVMRAQAAARAASPPLPPGLPLLTLQGGADTSTDPGASRAFTASHDGGAYREFPGLLHEVLNELPADRERVLDELAAWIRATRAAGEGRPPG